jgi:enoyl-CoA hydratase/carnithine racemase
VYKTNIAGKSAATYFTLCGRSANTAEAHPPGGVQGPLADALQEATKLTARHVLGDRQLVDQSTKARNLEARESTLKDALRMEALYGDDRFELTQVDV